MSHPEQRQFLARVKQEQPEFFHGQRVLEIGSLNINGTARDFFTDCDYTGVDLGPGDGVDVVGLGHEVAFDKPFDVALSCECFEHNPHWAATFLNMYKQVRAGGLIIVTCATVGRAEHGTARTSPQDAPLVPWDYYRNLVREDFYDHFDIKAMFSTYAWNANPISHDLNFWGLVKK